MACSRHSLARTAETADQFYAAYHRSAFRSDAGPRISSPNLGPDGRRVFHVGNRGESLIVVLDGKIGPAWEAILGASFTAEGRHSSYVRMKGTKWTVVVDGVSGKQFDDIASYRMRPDPAHLAYVARGEGVALGGHGEVRAVWDDSPAIVWVTLDAFGDGQVVVKRGVHPELSADLVKPSAFFP